MTDAEQFADRVTGRIALRVPDGGMAVTGVEILAILSAIIAACDEFNPGWREQVISFIGKLLPPWGREAREARRIEEQARKIRDRARNALNPDQAPLLKRPQARRDRAIVLDTTRAKVQMHMHQGPGLPENVVADAILEETLVSSDQQIDRAIRDLGVSVPDLRTQNRRP